MFTAQVITMEMILLSLFDHLAGSTAYSAASTFGQGTGPILFTDLHCSGSEHSLLACHKSVFGVTSCTHSHDVGLKCEGNVMKDHSVMWVLHVRSCFYYSNTSSTL